MRRLLLMRHAKSDWSADYSTDHERPLNKRGRKAARTMGQFLAQFAAPDLILSSPANRARQTVELACESGDLSCPTRIIEEFYEGSINDILRHIRRVEDQHECLLIAGHEPTWSDLAGRLIGMANVRMVTAAVACIQIEVESWQGVAPAGGQLCWLVTPRALQSLGFV